MKYRESVMAYIMESIIRDLKLTTHVYDDTTHKELTPAQFKKWQRQLAKEGIRIAHWLGQKGWVIDGSEMELEKYIYPPSVNSSRS